MNRCSYMKSCLTANALLHALFYTITHTCIKKQRNKSIPSNTGKTFFPFIKLSICFAVLFMLFDTNQNRVVAQTADIVLTNGKIFTSDTSQLYVQAMAVKGNKIMAIGNNATINKLTTPKTQKIDLQGRTVVPGFNVAHNHPGIPDAVRDQPWGSIGKTFYPEISFEGPSKKAVLDSVARLAKTAKPNEWISGAIGNAVLFDSSMMTAIDSVAADHPVLLFTWWGHGMAVNHKALQVSGVPYTEKDMDPHGFWIGPVYRTFLLSASGNLIKAMQFVCSEQLKHGITTEQYMGAPLTGAQAVDILQKANLPQRVRLIAWPAYNKAGRKLSEWNAQGVQPTALSYISGVKYPLDGTPIERGSLMKKPYEGTKDWYGKLNYPIDTIKQILQDARKSNTQLMMHITGDSTMAIVLSLMKEMATPEVWRTKRVRIEHNATQHITAAEANTLRDLGLLVMHTPMWNRESPLRSFLNKGITVGISPDGITLNPFWDIMVITSQQSDPNENITREQAVIAYTRTNAYAEFKETEKGTLMPGMLADLAVLSQDIFTIPAEQLSSTTSVLTMVDGKIVYQRSSGLTAKK